MTTRSTWTDEALQTLKSMWLAGATSSTIGNALGLSRNTVLGKIDRLRMTRKPHARKNTTLANKPAKADRHTQKAKKRPRMTSKKGLNRAEVIARNVEFLKTFEPFKETVLDIECRQVSLSDLKTFGMCRWPFGDVRVGGVTYCGNDCNVKDSYCGPHKALAYRPVAVSA